MRTFVYAISILLMTLFTAACQQRFAFDNVEKTKLLQQPVLNNPSGSEPVPTPGTETGPSPTPGTETGPPPTPGTETGPSPTPSGSGIEPVPTPTATPAPTPTPGGSGLEPVPTPKPTPTPVVSNPTPSPTIIIPIIIPNFPNFGNSNPTPTPAPVNIPSDVIQTVNVCSDTGVQEDGTSLLSATNGVSVEMYHVDGRTDTMSSAPSLSITDSTQMKNIRNTLINQKSLTLDVRSLADGVYSLFVCDPAGIAGNQCGSPNHPYSPVVSVVAPLDVQFYVTVSKGHIVAKSRHQPVTGTNNFGTVDTSDPTLPVIYDVKRSGEASCDYLVSPLVVDMDNSGIDLTAPLDGVAFDMTGTGTKDHISWPSKSSVMFLALDKNNDGIITNINSLFGNNTVGPDGKKSANGFEALRKYDLNHDGVIDRKDAVFSQLRLWSDSNGNGVADPGEVHSLTEMGVKSIDLNYIPMSETDIYGNATEERSVLRLLNGQLRRIVDLWFRAI